MHAQSTDCKYEACALRLKRKFLTGGQIVRGVDEEHVASIWLLAPKISPLLEQTDSAGYYYQSFRTLHTRGWWLGLTGVALIVTRVIIAGGAIAELVARLTLVGPIPFSSGLT